MGRNSVLWCFRSSKTHGSSSSDHNIFADTGSSSSDSEDLSPPGIQAVPSCKLVPLPRDRAYPHHAVGIDDQVNCIIQLLEWENETNAAVAVVLHGLGGTGKTTLAEAVAARLDIQGWNYSTVVPFETSLHGSHIDRNFEDAERDIKDIFEKEQAFIYIDNGMVRGEHLRKLLSKPCKNLRLLLTARDETDAEVISGCGIHSNVYHVRPLHSEDGVKLLCKKIGDDAKMQIPHQISEVLKICDGVPLVLERVGEYICQSQDKDEAYRRVIEWSKNGNPFSSAEEYSIEKNGLLFDLDDLPASAKETFLDLCSFFNGWDWDKVSCIMGEDGLDSLRKRGLLLKKEECGNKVIVRPIILTIGRNMTKSKRFTSAHDLSKVLEGNDPANIECIKGIWLQDNLSEPFLISAKKLDLMHQTLRVLALGDMAIVVDGQCTQKFKQIIYFQAGLIPCIPFHPTTPQELRFLDCRLPHNYGDLRLSKMSSQLKLLNLNGRRLDTENGFGRLRGLRILKLSEFKRLKKLPEELKLLSQLEELDLSGCEKLVKLPKGLGDLKALSKLSLRSCVSLQELPDCFGKLRSLKYLDLHSCKNLKQLPEDFGSLTSLEELDLGYCSSLKELPSSFGKLSKLNVLTLVRCTRLNHLPDDIINLKALVRIEFQGSFDFAWSRLVSIPCRYIKLVKNLSSELCKQLTNLPKRLIEYTSLRSLDLYVWSSLERLPEGFGQLKLLAELNIQWCSSLQDLSSDFHCLASLQTLNLGWCEKLQGKWMDSVVKIKTLELVNILESPLLADRWAELAKGEKSWHFAIISREQTSSSDNVVNMLDEAASKLFTGDTLLTDSRGEPFSLSTVEPNTLLLVLYHYPCRPNISVNYLYRWKLLEEVVKHEYPPPFQMIYVGKCFGELPKTVAERIMAYASVDSDAHLFFKKAFYVNVASSIDYPKFVATEVVADGGGRKHFSSWISIEDSMVEFLLSKSTLYSHLEKLTETPQEGNGTLLRALFDTAELTTSSIFLRNYTEKVGFDQLLGKRVLLFVSISDGCADVIDDTIFQPLKEIYSKAKTNDDMEILSIPIPAEVRGEHEWPPGSDLAMFESILRNVPWPVLRNPWLLKTEVYYFLLKEYRGLIIPGILAVVEPNGRISNKNALPLVKRWGAEVYPFSDEKMKQLEISDESGSSG